MNTQHTSLALSKLIHERVPELETTDAYPIYATQVGSEEVKLLLGGAYATEVAPAYTFTDLLRAVQMLGEKEGLGDYTDIENEQHNILGNYLIDNLTIGENTEKYLTSLFTK